MAGKPECRTRFEDCQAWCMMNQFGEQPGINAAQFPKSRLNVRILDIASTFMQKGDDDNLNPQSSFPNTIAAYDSSTPRTSPLEAVVTGLGRGQFTEGECQQRCHVNHNQCRKDHWPYQEKQCLEQFNACQDTCGQFSKTIPSPTLASPSFQPHWTWDGITRGIRETGKPAYLVE
ncbi:uncharacterized protein PV09_01184 [Verruconis gallopava]|uniref:Uncharacterized protein n=1 Tax=Verruconis gallopava TaxID=253628 RepID=A0A0D2ANY7_9PEZI|nr:uncharacterized protein PV09_01184 [Verruconis gallopava]KIW08260.1 hypothetical protein PV09_01184 [Verruconis gallopava]